MDQHPHRDHRRAAAKRAGDGGRGGLLPMPTSGKGQSENYKASILHNALRNRSVEREPARARRSTSGWIDEHGAVDSMVGEVMNI
jgi:hypothetical protein